MDGMTDISIIRLFKPASDFEFDTETGHSLDEIQSNFETSSDLGNLYLGEQIQFAVIFNNTHRQPLDGNLSVELLSPSKRISLTSAKLVAIDAETHECFVFGYEVKEIGAYSVVCTFVNRSSEKFRKVVSFQARNPLSVRTKVSRLSDTFFLEVQLQNTCLESIYVRKVALNPVDGVVIANLKDIFSKLIFSPKDIRQYLFVLKSNSEDLHLGKLDLGWRNENGQFGRLQTSTLSRKEDAISKFTVKLIEKPEKVRVEEPFDAKFKLYHNFDPDLFANLELSSRIDSAILPYGQKCTVELNFKGKDSIEFKVKLIAVEAGLVSLDDFLVISNSETWQVKSETQFFVYVT